MLPARCVVLALLLLAFSAAEPTGPVPPPTGAPSVKLGTGTVVLYPVPDQEDVPTTFPGSEVPDPIPKATKPQAGYPVTASFGPRMVVAETKGTLYDDAMAEVPTWLSSPRDPANPKHAGSQQNTLCLFPMSPLKPATTYTVKFEAKVDGTKWQRTYRFTTAPERIPEGVVAAVLERLNTHRTAAGLDKVELDADLAKACQAHARYLAQNLPDDPNLKLRDEDPARPGATEEGRKAAAKAVVLRGVGGPEAIDLMFGIYTNRATTLYPGLKKIGLGVAHDPGGGQLWVLETQRFAGPFVPPTPTCFPPPDAKDVPLVYPTGATKHPVPDAKARDKAGYAVSALCWTNGDVADVEAKLRKKDGPDIECWRSTPAEPAISGIVQNAVMLIPKTPLDPGTTYDVSMSATIDGKPWKAAWSFTTEPPDARIGDRAATEKKVLALLNAYRTTAGVGAVALDPALSAMCEKHAHYLRRNQGHPSTEGLGMHNEDAKLPGYTADGAKAGKAGVITLTHAPLASVPGWIDTLYHRVPLLEPRLQKVGFAAVPLPDRRWVCVLYARP